MRARIIIVIMIFLLLPVTVYAEDTSPIDKLDRLSDEALQMVKLQRYDDAKKLLDYFSAQFSTVYEKERAIPADVLRIVTISHDEAVQATTNTSINHNEKINRVTQFRLVMDAITSPNQPLWTEMESPIMTVFGEMKEAVYSGDKENYHMKLNHFLSLYDIIYPSVKIDVAAERVHKLDTQIDFIDRYRLQVLAEEESQQELEILEANLQLLFDDMSDDEADPSLWWVIISTGSIIILTLSYVGWKKYKGEKIKEKNRSRGHKH